MGLEFEDFKRKRVEGAIVAFIRGKKNANWVMGIIRGRWGVRDVELQRIFDKIPTTYINYDKGLLNQLKHECLNEGLL
jgi:hypothetical protein